MVVEVFKTNVRQKKEARPLVRILSENFPRHKINFDLEDCDKILRVEGENIRPKKIITMLQEEGFKCAVLK